MNNQLIAVAQGDVEKEELWQDLAKEKVAFLMDIDYEGTILPTIESYRDTDIY